MSTPSIVPSLKDGAKENADELPKDAGEGSAEGKSEEIAEGVGDDTAVRPDDAGAIATEAAVVADVARTDASSTDSQDRFSHAERNPSNWEISQEDGELSFRCSATSRVFKGTMEEFNQALRGD